MKSLNRRSFLKTASLGVVALVGAAVAVLGMVSALASLFIMSALTESGPRMFWGAGPQALMWVWYVWRGVGVPVLMGVGGLLLLRRHRAGGVFMLVCACLAVLTTIAGPALEWILFDAPQFLRSPVYLVMRIPSLLVALVWPVFLMVWLLREKIRRQMRGWGRRRWCRRALAGRCQTSGIC